ncbi:hypothetical protein [Sporocytophaga myxococcoides]|uniref:hypothetical protein n=1 Tax=Sporocytophaga myxococcoides TaxID=153721 RepID=UPI000490EB77|nr:hypothetical protein [Sporocytophaga myxococcoides]
MAVILTVYNFNNRFIHLFTILKGLNIYRKVDVALMRPNGVVCYFPGIIYKHMTSSRSDLSSKKSLLPGRNLSKSAALNNTKDNPY